MKRQNSRDALKKAAATEQANAVYLTNVEKTFLGIRGESDSGERPHPQFP